ncbi:hypothetical protein JOF53_006546 [Crossiella equi]|uniref:Uncharacterized protein n=1 Tax=Crossiella equi TaxID=130796 RepID=A0ABS5AM81_9PSEU|nr:hypothetical protein [Crossiella equi]MBP2477674.1 hypothetical protein [Crossiella equi]
MPLDKNGRAKPGEGPSEPESMLLVGQALGCETNWFDDGSADGQYDFAAGAETAVEITFLTNFEEEMNDAALAGITASHPGTGLNRSWEVMLNDDARAKPTKKLGLIDALWPRLAELERREIREIAPWRGCGALPRFMHEPGCPVPELQQLGVHNAWQVPSMDHEARLHLTVVSFWDQANGPGDVAEVIEAEFAAKPDLAAKLARAMDRQHRHIFFWARHSLALETRELHSDTLPERKPVLPAEVTGVWVGVYGRWDRAFFYSQATGWVRHALRATPAGV